MTDSTTPENKITRKQFFDDVKNLQEDEYHEIFRILKRNEVDYSENTNGIFFDLNQLSEDVFQQLCRFMKLCTLQRESERKRNEELNSIRTQTLTE